MAVLTLVDLNHSRKDNYLARVVMRRETVKGRKSERRREREREKSGHQLRSFNAVGITNNSDEHSACNGTAEHTFNVPVKDLYYLRQQFLRFIPRLSVILFAHVRSTLGM